MNNLKDKSVKFFGKTRLLPIEPSIRMKKSSL